MKPVDPRGFHPPVRPSGHPLSSDQLQYPEPPPVLPVPSQPDPSVAAAPYQLTGPPFPIRELLVHDQLESRAAPDVGQQSLGPLDAHGEHIPRVGATPCPPHRRGIT